MWTRRQFLEALAASSTLGVAHSGFSGCSKALSLRAAAVPRPQSQRHLQVAFATIDATLDSAFVWFRAQQSSLLSVDSNEKQDEVRQENWVVLGGVAQGLPREVALLNPSQRDLQEAAASLAGAGPSFAGPSKGTEGGNELVLLATVGDAARRRMLQKFYERAEQFGDSRIVYRSAFLRSQAAIGLRISSRGVEAFSSEEQRAGLLLSVWTGRDIAVAELDTVVKKGDGEVVVSDGELQQCRQNALAHLHARSAPNLGIQELLLSPACVSQLLFHGFAMPACALHAPLPAPTDAVQLVDSPSLGYGRFVTDALGEAATEVTLLGSGAQVLRKGRMRRDRDALARCTPSHVRLLPTASHPSQPLQTLIAKVEQGVLMDGPVHCSYDALTSRIVLVASRGKEIIKGRFTGRVYGRIAMKCDRDDWVAQSQGLSDSPREFPGELSDMPFSIACPHWLSRGALEGA